MQALHLLALDPFAEHTADRNSYGFRKERSCADAIAQCFIALAKQRSPQWVLEGDIRACFDRINHDWLLAHVPMDRALLQQWLQAGYLESRVLFPTEAGTPQGGIISPVLANLALDGMEALLQQHFGGSDHRSRKHQVNLIRYADDFVVTGSSRELLENEVKPLLIAFLAERGLELSPEKTSITQIEAGFDFLGQNVRKYGGKLLIKPSHSNVRHHLTHLQETVKQHRGQSAGALIRKLNPKITGWANYHRHIVAKETFSRVDHALFRMLWRWALRRHRNKGCRWIRDRYFRTQPGPAGGRNWVFFGEVVDGKQQVQTLTLRAAADTKIRRHVKLRGEVNPYDPRWHVYLASRHRRAPKPTAPDWPQTHPLPMACGGATKRDLTASLR